MIADTGKPNKFAYWGNDDVTSDLGLEKFDVDLRNIDFPLELKKKLR